MENEQEIIALLDRECKKVMIEWDVNSFAVTHPNLLRAIINAIKIASGKSD
jgi:predicted transglutaminase-like protease